MNEIYDYLEAGFRLFGIYGTDKKGNCECENPSCEALYKHPRISNWQQVPSWSEEQIETFTALGHFNTGFGVLCQGWLIIDIDARNGGVESFQSLCSVLPDAATAQYIVNTGSGNGSQHHYFRMLEPVPMVQNLKQYPGIDFKTSGYVIGAGSMHKSGSRYEREKGFPQDVEAAPDALIDLLKKPDMCRVEYNGGDVDITERDISMMLAHITPDLGYEDWIRIGMAIHHCTGGFGFDLWDDWSRHGKEYKGVSDLEKHWHSFGKSSNPAGYGTLMHHAREGGYIQDVTFEYDIGEAMPTSLEDDTIDLLRPPGFVGELTAWINAQCLYPRETLAVASALTAISSLTGMRFFDEMDGIGPNMISFCVAGSGTGKEKIIQSYLQIMRAAGIQGAVHGGIKSDQEIYRNLIRHQAALYCIDEISSLLKRLDNSTKRGGASYLEGVIGTVMSVYSKSNGFLPVTGDLKEDIRAALLKELARTERQLEDLMMDSSTEKKRRRLEGEIERIQADLNTIDDGIDGPYLTLIGFTMPTMFNELMTFEQATNGFFARAMTFVDLESNPRRKSQFHPQPMPDRLRYAIQNLWAPGYYDDEPIGRVEFRGDKTGVPTAPEARLLLDEAYDAFYELAEEHKAATGLEAIPRRGYELTAKVSLLLAIPSGVRTAEHVRWAYALAKRDLDLKIKMTYATANENDNGLVARILSLLTKDHGETFGVICNRLRNAPKAQVESLLKKMIEQNFVYVVDFEHPKNKKIVSRYYSVK